MTQWKCVRANPRTNTFFLIFFKKGAKKLGALNSDSVDEVITIEEYETFKTLICNGYTYSEAKSAIVVGEKMNFSVELLCEAKIQSIEDKSNGKEIDTTYS